MTSGQLASPVQKEIGLSEEQKSTLKRIRQESYEKVARLGEEELGILTPQQKEKLRAEVDRLGF